MRCRLLCTQSEFEEFNRSYAGSIDIVTARALAPLTDLLAFAEPWLARGGKVFFPKGREVETELAVAGKSWRMDFDLLESRTQAGARIIVVRSAQPLAAAGQHAQRPGAP